MWREIYGELQLEITFNEYVDVLKAFIDSHPKPDPFSQAAREIIDLHRKMGADKAGFDMFYAKFTRDLLISMHSGTYVDAASAAIRTEMKKTIVDTTVYVSVDATLKTKMKDFDTDCQKLADQADKLCIASLSQLHLFLYSLNLFTPSGARDAAIGAIRTIQAQIVAAKEKLPAMLAALRAKIAKFTPTDPVTGLQRDFLALADYHKNVIALMDAAVVEIKKIPVPAP